MCEIIRIQTMCRRWFISHGLLEPSGGGLTAQVLSDTSKLTGSSVRLHMSDMKNFLFGRRSGKTRDERFRRETDRTAAPKMRGKFHHLPPDTAQFSCGDCQDGTKRKYIDTGELWRTTKTTRTDERKNKKKRAHAASSSLLSAGFEDSLSPASSFLATGKLGSAPIFSRTLLLSASLCLRLHILRPAPLVRGARIKCYL